MDSLQPQTGIVSAASLLFVALGNPSLAGSAFLLFFLAWIFVCLPRLSWEGGLVASKRVWSLAAGVSSIALALQLGVQLAIVARTPGIRHHAVLKTLEILGFSKVSTSIDFLFEVVPLFLAAILTAHQATVAAKMHSRYHRMRLEGIELHDNAGQLSPRASHSHEHNNNATVIAALALLGAAFCHPALLSLPYLATLVFLLHRWSKNVTFMRSIQPLSSLQGYAAFHLTALYAWQWSLSYAASLRPIAELLGLFIVDYRTQSASEFTAGALVFVSLACLVTALGYSSLYLGHEEEEEEDERDAVEQQSQSDVHAPLLDYDYSATANQDQKLPSSPRLSANHPSHHHMSLKHWIASLLPYWAHLAISSWQYVFYSSVPMGAAVCAVTFIRPSLIGSILLLSGVIVLHQTCGKISKSTINLLFGAVVGWLCACYVATALQLQTDLSDAIGVHAFPTNWPILALLGAGAAIALHLSSMDILIAYQPSRNLQSAVLALGAWALPAALFSVGALKYDVLHSVLLIGLVAVLAASTLRFKPAFYRSNTTAAWSLAVLKFYSSLALIAMYAVYVGGFDAFKSALQPADAQDVLSAIGLWHLNVVDMLPFAGLLVLVSALAAVLASFTTSAAAPQPSQPPPRINGVPTWHPWWLIQIARKSITYGPFAVSLVLYCIVLLDCDTALLGMLYLALGVCCLTIQPRKGQWMERHGALQVLSNAMLGTGPSSSSSLAHPDMSDGAVLVGSGTVGWIPMMFTAFIALVDFVFQAALPAVVSSAWPIAVPKGVVDFLKLAIGIDADAAGLDLALRLLRPCIILVSLALYRNLYCIGILHRQLAHAQLDDAAFETRRLLKQWEWGALFKRLCIVHAAKIVLVVAFAAAMQMPSVLGGVLVVGVVSVPPFVGPGPSLSPFVHSRLDPISHRRALDISLNCAQMLAALWMLLQYTAQITWIKSAAVSYGLDLDFMKWIGIDAQEADVQVESMLRLKAALIVVVALVQKALMWWAKLPEVVRAEAKCGAACPVFWPPMPNYPKPALQSSSVELAQGELTAEEAAGGAGLVAQPLASAREAFQSMAQCARVLAQQALQALDWPSPRPQEGVLVEYNLLEDEVMPANALQQQQKEEEAMAMQQPSPSPLPPQHHLEPVPEVSLSQPTTFRFALQDWAERCYDDWGLEIALFALLFASFIAANALSLVYLAGVAIGMATPPRMRIYLWKCTVVPCLGIILLWQYAELVGWPPSNGRLLIISPFGDVSLSDDVKTWLGLLNVDFAAVWALFFAFSAAVWQEHCDRAKTCDEPLLQHTGGSSPPSQPTINLWAPLDLSAQSQWRWHDWLRYQLYRRSLDFLLIAVVILCTLDNDIIHAGYLALALFFFRSRVALRVRRNKLFVWLPVYNFAVMAVVLAYQAPFEDIWDWPLDDGKSCTLSHLLGLYKLCSSPDGGDAPSSLLSWGYEGAMADIILWIFIRLQTHLFASPTFCEVVAVAEAEEERERAARKAEVAEWKQEQAMAAVEESKQRAARAVRISRIKKGVDRSLNLFGAGVSPTVLDFAFLELGAEKPKGQPLAEAEESMDAAESFESSATLRQRRGKQQREGSRRDTAYEDQGDAEAMLTEYETQLAKASQIDLQTAGGASVTLHTATISSNQQKSSNVFSWIASLLPRRADRRESALAYALFIFAYLTDLSLLTLVLPLSAFAYALVAVRPSRLYWHAVLMYCELLIVVSYAFQAPSRLDCGFITSNMEYMADMLGIHAQAARRIPLFFVYLATLRHTHGLLTRHAAGQRVAAAATEQQTAASNEEAGLDEVEVVVEDYDEIGLEPEEAVTSSPSWFTQSFDAVSTAAASVWEFLLTACTACERPPAFVLVELQTPQKTASEQEIEASLQSILNAQRNSALAREQLKRRQSSASSSEESWEGSRRESRSNLMSSSALMNDIGSALASVGPLQLRFHSFIDDDDASLQKQRVLLEVVALQSTPENTPDVCTSPGWPLRSLRPAALAAAAITSGANASDNITEVTLAEPHGRQARDFYAATAMLDILSFLFVAVFYNRVVQAAGSLSEITSQHVVPLGYLITLIVLFMFVVMDRVVYTLGNAAGKAALHAGEMALIFWYCSSLVWSPHDPGPSAAPPLDHLRILLALKSASFALSALQLRTGYPPPASYANGMGRHTFIFMRSVSVPASLAFHLFTAVPFLYEMRQLLDWACTATTLTLYDWFKLEDINMSLYFSAVMRQSRAGRPLGTRQPRYLKFFQGTLLFSGLLVLLWVPLLVFSTGNPTYQVPTLAAFSVNVTLQATSAKHGRVAVPLFRAGDRGTWSQWVVNTTLPDALAADYSPEQLQVLCTPSDADTIWAASPPARRALSNILASSDADVAVSFGWDVLRDLPPPSEHGGPGCSGLSMVALAPEAIDSLLDVLNNKSTSAPLLRYYATDSGAMNVTSALFPAFWLMRGDACTSRPLQQSDVRGAEALPSRRKSPSDLTWTDRWLACNAKLLSEGESSGVWWSLECSIVDATGVAEIPMPEEQEEEEEASSWPITCPSLHDDDDPSSTNLFNGPRIVAVLDRVQGGIIGATLNKFGVIGLYSVFVYGIGRFLRLSLTNLRMRIPYEDLPTTRRLVSLCQDIYIARAEGLLALEEELYGALLAVYRLPSVMYELTKKSK